MNIQRQLNSGRYLLFHLFHLDIRALALFRICLATLLLIDLWQRVPNISAHYTDAGVLPRSALIQEFMSPWAWSFHLINGQWIFQMLLFLLAALGALALLVGYRTSLATLCSWALLLSLHNRNWMVLNGGDDVLRLLLFWGMFLPLEAAYSVDSALNQTVAPPAKKICSAATIALILQICFIYWFSALLKNHPIWWQEGSATYYALSLDYIRTGFGQFLLNFPVLLTLATFVTLRIEILGPLLIFFPFNTALFRTIAIFLFCGLHLGFASSLHLGLFPFVCCAAWLSLLPTEVWEFLSKRYQLEKFSKLEIYYDQDCGFCKKIVHLIRTFFILPGATLSPAQPDPEIYQEMQAMNSWVVRGINGRSYFGFEGITYLASCSPVLRVLLPLLEWAPVSALGNTAYQWVANHRKQASVVTKPLKFSPLKMQLPPAQAFFVWVALIVITWWNLNTINPTQFPVPNEVRAFARVLGIYQKWDLFAPYPTTRDGWLVIPGRLEDGREVDIYNNGQPVSWDKPGNVSTTYKDPQWRKYLTHLYGEKNEDRRLYYGQYLCRTWNAAHSGDDYLTQFQIYFMLERTPPPGQTPEIERVSLWRHTCSPQTEK